MLCDVRKVAMLRERFLLVQQRLQRNEIFCKPLIASANRSFIEVWPSVVASAVFLL